MQRLRIVFAKCVEVKYISHLDLVRAWERALRRANVALAYSHGFNPRPKLFFASALPVGFTGSAEIVDVILQHRLELHDFTLRLKRQLPPGLQLISVAEVPNTLPPLPSQVVAAEYQVVVESQETPDEILTRLNNLQAAKSIPQRRERPGRARVYDLRPLIKQLWLIGQSGNRYVIGMCLQANEQGTGRPNEVMAALGMAEGVRSIERVRIILGDH